MKRILCGTLVPGCTFKVQAETEAEAVQMEVEHARNAHRIEVTPGFVARAKARIEDVPPRKAQAS